VKDVDVSSSGILYSAAPGGSLIKTPSSSLVSAPLPVTLRTAARVLATYGFVYVGQAHDGFAELVQATEAAQSTLFAPGGAGSMGQSAYDGAWLWTANPTVGVYKQNPNDLAVVLTAAVGGSSAAVFVV
jgi:hypothetical protein